MRACSLSCTGWPSRRGAPQRAAANRDEHRGVNGTVAQSSTFTSPSALAAATSGISFADYHGSPPNGVGLGVALERQGRKNPAGQGCDRTQSFKVSVHSATPRYKDGATGVSVGLLRSLPRTRNRENCHATSSAFPSHPPDACLSCHSRFRWVGLLRYHVAVIR